MFIAGISRLANYMSYITDDGAPPSSKKQSLPKNVMASKNKFTWWNNSWHVLNQFQAQDPSDFSLKGLKEDEQTEHRCWRLKKLSIPTNVPKLRTYRLFKTSFATSPYLNNGPHYLHPAILRFQCSNHRLDIEVGRHLNKPCEERSYRFCIKHVLGDEYHAFQCEAFLDLQVLCDINVTSHPSSLKKCNLLR